MQSPSQVVEVSEANKENGTNVKSFITQGQSKDKGDRNVKGRTGGKRKGRAGRKGRKGAQQKKKKIVKRGEACKAGKRKRKRDEEGGENLVNRGMYGMLGKNIKKMGMKVKRKERLHAS